MNQFFFCFLNLFSFYLSPFQSFIISFTPPITSCIIKIYKNIKITICISISAQPGPLPPNGSGFFTNLSPGLYVTIANYLVFEIISLDTSGHWASFAIFPQTSVQLGPIHYQIGSNLPNIVISLTGLIKLIKLLVLTLDGIMTCRRTIKLTSMA